MSTETAVTLDLEMLPVAAFTVDHRHRITACNAAAERLFGCDASALIGQRCSKVMTSMVSAACLGCDQWCGRQVARPTQTGAASSIQLQRGDSADRLHINVLLAQAASGEPRYVHLLHVLPPEQTQDPATAATSAPSAQPIPPQIAAMVTPGTAGDSHVPPVFARAPGKPSGDHGLLDPPPVHLTTRELDILRLLAEGLTTHEIAERSFISYSTARNHISSIIAKLGATTRLQAVIFARQLSLL